MAVHQPPLEDIESKARASIVNCAAPADHNILAGKHVFITGGASGLGKAYARAAASHGARVTIADVNAELGEQVVAEAVKEGLK